MTTITPTNAHPVYLQPSSSVGIGVAPVVTATTAANIVLKTSAGNLYDVYCFSSISCFLLGFDATSVPSDGTVTPKWIAQVPANESAGMAFSGLPPAAFSTGCCFCVSTTGPYTKTTPGSGTFFFSGRVL